MINVVKIGGNVIDDHLTLDTFLKDFSTLQGHKILVHGGGKEANRLSQALGIKPMMIEGRRITDRETLAIVTMVYAGLINKNIVAHLQSLNCDAIGLTGADGNVIEAKRRLPQPIDYGYVGDINPKDINISFISKLLEEGMVPVFCAITHDRKGSLLNCNADSVASAVAVAMSYQSAVRLTYCFEKPGVLSDINDENSVIPHINKDSFKSLKEKGIVAAGMIPKLQNALSSAADGVAEVRICRAEDLINGGGTIISE